MRSARPATALILILALLAACGGDKPRASRARCPKPSGLISIGEPIPGTCELERFEGGFLRLEDLKGKPAILNFWATWCPFCIKEMPSIEKVHQRLGSRVTIIGADLLDVDGETRATAERFAKKTGVTYDLVYDQGGVLFGNFSGQLLLPVTIFVRPNGIVAYRQFGPLTETTLTALIKKYLGIR